MRFHRIYVGDWRHWFAWRPVYVDRNTLVWWEPLERRAVGGYDDCWEYRFPYNDEHALRS